MPILDKGFKDKVPNVRIVSIKLADEIIKYIDTVSKDRIKG